MRTYEHSPASLKRRREALKRQDAYWQRKNGPVIRTTISPPNSEPIEDRRLPDEGKALGHASV